MEVFDIQCYWLFEHEIFLRGVFLTVVALKLEFLAWIVDNAELAVNVLIVGNAFRIDAFYYVADVFRQFNLLFLNDIKVLDGDYGCCWSNEGNLIEFIVFEEFVGEFDDTFLAIFFA